MDETKLFNSEQEARTYIKNLTRDYISIEPEIVAILSDDIIHQEHFSYLNIENQEKLHFSLITTDHGCEVKKTKQKDNDLVFACDVGDKELFLEEIQKVNSERAIALAFKMSIYNDRYDFVKVFFDKELLSDIELFENPLETATVKDSLDSFKLLFQHYGIPDNILAKILHNNSLNILKYLFSNKILYKSIILENKYVNDWVKSMLSSRKNKNETIDFYLESIIN